VNAPHDDNDPDPAQPPRAAADPVVLFSARSDRQDVFVVEHEGQRLLRFDRPDGNDQSAVDPTDPGRLVFEYTRLATLGVVLSLSPSSSSLSPSSSSSSSLLASNTVARPRRALVVGLGGGAFASWLVRHDGAWTVDVVEHDAVVVDVARRFFFLPQTPRLAVHPGCGAAFVARARRGYDLVLLDAFSGAGIPGALSSSAFFSDVRRVVADDGVVLLNIALVTRDDTTAITRRFTGVFAGAVLVRGLREDNVVLFGARRGLSPGDIEAAAARAVDVTGLDVAGDIGAVRACR
jgi:spermidine synthase